MLIKKKKLLGQNLEIQRRGFHHVFFLKLFKNIEYNINKLS